MRVLAREHDEVDDGWLCDKGRFAYQATHVDERITQPLVREGAALMPASWEKALDHAASALKKAGGRAAALAGGDTTNEEAFLLQRLFREGLGSAHLAGAPGRAVSPGLSRALADPALQATVPDLEYAHAVLVLDCDPVDDAPILDLRIRKGVRRHHVKLAVATARPSALDPNAETVLRTAPGGGEALLVALDAALGGDDGALGGAATAAGSNATSVRSLADWLGGAGEDVVILYGERLLAGPRGDRAAQALLNLAARLGLAGHAGAGLLEIPARDERPRHPRGRLRRRARSGLRRRGGRRGRPRARVRRRRRRRPVPAARRPALDRARPRRLGGRAAVGDDGDRPRRDAHRRARRARRRDLPRRGLRREGGDDRPSRRPAPAAPARDRAPGPARRRACAPAGRSSPTSHGARAPTSACTRDRWPRSSCSTRSRSTPG